MTRVSVRSIRRNDLTSLRRLVQLYLYDLGGSHWNVEANGTFGGPAWHRYFWRRRGRRHFVILVGGRLAGFALVSDHAHFAGKGVREINDFFVLRRYRDRGVGIYVARMLFARFPGRWEVSEITWNVAARRFCAGSSSVARSVALWSVDAVTALSDSSCSTSRQRKGNVDRKTTQPGRPPQPDRPLLCKRPAAKSSRKRGGPCSAYEGGAGPVALAMRSGRR